METCRSSGSALPIRRKTATAPNQIAADTANPQTVNRLNAKQNAANRAERINTRSQPLIWAGRCADWWMGTTRGVSAFIASSFPLSNDCRADAECRQYARCKASHHGAYPCDQRFLAEAGQLVLDHYRARPHHHADYADSPGHWTS